MKLNKYLACIGISERKKVVTVQEKNMNTDYFDFPHYGSKEVRQRVIQCSYTERSVFIFYYRQVHYRGCYLQGTGRGRHQR